MPVPVNVRYGLSQLPRFPQFPIRADLRHVRPGIVSYRSPAAVVYSRGLLLPERIGC